MEVILYPDDRLKQKCNDVELENISNHIDLAHKMYKTIQKHNAIGLAANQVGETIRLIVIKFNEKPVYMFNPVLIQASRNQYKLEGCLSFPKQIKKCKRAQLIKVKYIDINGKIQYNQFKGLEARCIQHEIDHLNGVLFYEREKPE